MVGKVVRTDMGGAYDLPKPNLSRHYDREITITTTTIAFEPFPSSDSNKHKKQSDNSKTILINNGHSSSDYYAQARVPVAIPISLFGV